MPFTVKDLIANRPEPITTNRNASVQDALCAMIDGDFSQLPVVDSDRRVEGMITSDSITRALRHFDLTIKQMRVFHAMTDVPTYDSEEELLGLLDDLKNTYAVLAVDKNKRLDGIITSYDTTEYFRRRGEDNMLLEDIETMLKEYILVAFQDDPGALDLAIEEISTSNSKLRRPFGQALEHYLKDGAEDMVIDQQRADKAFSLYLNTKQPRSFEELSLNDYIELFVNKARWERYRTVFDLDPGACRKLLVAVRDIRNEIAHFRSEMTPSKREQLRFCKEWLGRHQQEISSLFASSTAGPSEVMSDVPVPASDRITENGTNILANIFSDVLKAVRLGKIEDNEEIPLQLVEPENARESRYTPLALHLQTLPLNQDKEEISFEDIELLIGGRLPPYARQHRSWWANDSTAHVQSIQWLAAGWRVSSVNMSGERVVFSRIKGREQAYIQFFSELLTDLRTTTDIPINSISPDGQSWVNVLRLGSQGEGSTSFLGFSFARGGQFRVELYIDQGDQERNKQLFDELHARAEEIENSVGETLSWERLDNRRASRIAAYQSGTINDSPEALTRLRQWATWTMIKFYNVFRPLLLHIGNSA